jgi:hypothetical protein
MVIKERGAYFQQNEAAAHVTENFCWLCDVCSSEEIVGGSNSVTGFPDLSIMLVLQTTFRFRNHIFFHAQVKRWGIVCVVAQSLVQ